MSNDWADTLASEIELANLADLSKHRFHKVMAQALRDERERCAKICDAYEKRHLFGDGSQTVHSMAGEAMAKTIRGNDD